MCEWVGIRSSIPIPAPALSSLQRTTELLVSKQTNITTIEPSNTLARHGIKKKQWVHVEIANVAVERPAREVASVVVVVYVFLLYLKS